MRKSDAIFRAVVSFCLLLILAGGGYLFYHYALLPRKLQAENARYAALYVRAQETPALSPEPLPEQTVPPTWEPVISPAPETPTPETTAEPGNPRARSAGGGGRPAAGLWKRGGPEDWAPPARIRIFLPP